MKKYFPPLFFLFFTGTFLHAQVWQESFEEALQEANAQDNPIVLVFSGSDWCAPCIRLKRKIFDSKEFKEYASSHYIMYNADFPRKKKNRLPDDKLNSNKLLAEKFNSPGYFPLVVVLDKEQAVLGKTGFEPKWTPKEYISILNRFLQ